MRRALESQSMVSGVEEATLLCRIAASVIAFSLLPLAARQAEIAEQRGDHQERDHRARDSGALAELAAGDAALERQCRQQMRGIDRPAAGDGVDQLEIGEGEDDR